jgi:transposase
MHPRIRPCIFHGTTAFGKGRASTANVQDFVPKGHVSRFIDELVRESLDFKEITGSYVSGLGQPSFDPRMMVALLLHGYLQRATR